MSLIQYDVREFGDTILVFEHTLIFQTQRCLLC